MKYIYVCVCICVSSSIAMIFIFTPHKLWLDLDESLSWPICIEHREGQVDNALSEEYQQVMILPVHA